MDKEELLRKVNALAALAQRSFCIIDTEYDEPQPELDCEEPVEDCPSGL